MRGANEKGERVNHLSSWHEIGPGDAILRPRSGCMTAHMAPTTKIAAAHTPMTKVTFSCIADRQENRIKGEQTKRNDDRAPRRSPRHSVRSLEAGTPMFVTTSMPNARKNKPPRNSQAVPTPKTAVIRNIRANESQAVAHVGVLPRRARGCADGAGPACRSEWSRSRRRRYHHHVGDSGGACVVREGVPELLGDPGRRRMGGDGRSERVVDGQARGSPARAAGGKVTVGTTNRSAAMIWLAWLVSKVRHVCNGGARMMPAHVFRDGRSTNGDPDLFSSPWICGAP